MNPSRITGIRAIRAARTAPQIAACSRPPSAASTASGLPKVSVMAVTMASAFSVTPAATAVVTIVPAFAVAALVGLTLIPATVIAVIVFPPAVFTPLIMSVPVVTVAPVATVPVSAVVVTIANL